MVRRRGGGRVLRHHRDGHERPDVAGGPVPGDARLTVGLDPDRCLRGRHRGRALTRYGVGTRAALVGRGEDRDLGRGDRDRRGRDLVGDRPRREQRHRVVAAARRHDRPLHRARRRHRPLDLQAEGPHAPRTADTAGCAGRPYRREPMTAPAPARELSRRSRPSRFDFVLAGVVLVAQVGGTALAASHQPERRGIDVLAVALLAAGPVALVWRRRFPLGVYGVSFAATLAYSSIGYGRGPIFFSLIVAFVTVVNAGHRAVA